MGALKMWPTGHLIMTLSSGPSVDLMMNLQRTSAGNPHRAMSSLPK
jgi:hypothetical protein